MTGDRMNGRRSGFTVVEVLVVMVMILIVVAMIRPSGGDRRARGQRIKCVNNLKTVGLALRIYATDNADQFPGALFITNRARLSSVSAADYFLMITNELSTPKIIVCPADKLSQQTECFTNFTTKNISYFASLTAKETDPDLFLAGDRNLMSDGNPVASGLFHASTNKELAWSKEMHMEQGNIAMGDGSVQQFSSSRLRQAMRETMGKTNLLVIP